MWVSCVRDWVAPRASLYTFLSQKYMVSLLPALAQKSKMLIIYRRVNRDGPDVTPPGPCRVLTLDLGRWRRDCEKFVQFRAWKRSSRTNKSRLWIQRHGYLSVIGSVLVLGVGMCATLRTYINKGSHNSLPELSENSKLTTNCRHGMFLNMGGPWKRHVANFNELKEGLENRNLHLEHIESHSHPEPLIV